MVVTESVTTISDVHLQNFQVLNFKSILSIPYLRTVLLIDLNAGRPICGSWLTCRDPGRSVAPVLYFDQFCFLYTKIDHAKTSELDCITQQQEYCHTTQIHIHTVSALNYD